MYIYRIFTFLEAPSADTSDAIIVLSADVAADNRIFESDNRIFESDNRIFESDNRIFRGDNRIFYLRGKG